MGDVGHRVFLKRGREQAVLARHPWVFSGAVERAESLPDARDGELCDLFDSSETWLARGTLHKSSQIVCRILTWKKEEEIDAAFFRTRCSEALEMRRSMIDHSKTDSYRLINAEADRLPGLIVDRYANALVTQTLTTGMVRFREEWCSALEELLSPEVIVDRSERARRDPGLSGDGGVLKGTLPSEPIWIRENDLRFRLSLTQGQKTGFYLDQRENRMLLGSLVKDKEVLNGFAYTGSFGVYAGRAGASHVVQVEASEAALAEAEVNWKENGLEETAVDHVQDDIFSYLRGTDRSFDAIVLDPPPYAKQKGNVDRAARAYKDVNLWAMKRLRPGGFLFTFSCSQHVSAELFQKILFGAARDAGASLQWLRRLGAGCDHPVHLDHPQGEYLKGFLLRMIEREQSE